jgi:1-aminocyclopropane-1-carboxylate deaminase/D-cysteine desulfhydrase-like pyridoxal-dependent ACC family enzyme
MSSQPGHHSFNTTGFPPRIELTTTPTPLEHGGPLPSGAQLWVKRDDLTGLGAGGNKGRKLEYLCAEALAQNADCLVTVGAAQSNHCRMTAAAGARLGLETHLVLAGSRPAQLEGNQLLSHMFGATLHHTGFDDAQWKELESFRSALTDDLRSQGRRPHSIPIGGSTPMGALGYWRAFDEIMSQCQQQGFTPDVIIHTSSSGGTHAGLIAGLAYARSQLRPHCPIIAIGVAKGAALTAHSVLQLAQNTLLLTTSDALIDLSDVQIESRFLGDGYAVPTDAGTAATHWAAQRGAWILDSVYTAKGFSGLLGLDAEGVFSASQNVVFIHTGGLPSVFAH